MAARIQPRKFLGLLGASLALAGIGGCSVRPAPEGTIVPYVHPPEEVLPGVPLYYATTIVHAGDAVGLLVESHEGRPTKIEGNPDHPASLGHTDAFHQASILTLYDPARSQAVMQGDQISGWDDVETAIRTALSEQRNKQGGGLRILTETIYSPTLAWQLKQLLADLPDAKQYRYQPVSRWNAYQAARTSFGRPVDPVYDFKAADVALSLDSDFLVSEPGHVRYANDFMARRQVPRAADKAKSAEMNRLYVVETALSSTGAKADHRLSVRMADVEWIGRLIARALDNGQAEGDANSGDKHARWAAAVARDLKSHAGRSLVLAGYRQSPAVHQLVHALNERLGNVGKTVRYIESLAANPADPVAELQSLADDIDRGDVEVLFVLGGDPAYTAPANLDIAAKLRKVQHSFHLGLYENATSRACKWHLPEAHYLEAWSDARAYDGTASIVQPLIDPLYEGRSAHEVIGLLSGTRNPYGREFLKSYWRQQRDVSEEDEAFRKFWEASLHDGLVADSAFRPLDAPLQGESLADLAAGGGPPSGSSAGDANSLEIVFQADPTIYDGRYANNGWLQELPKPVTKLTWDNAAIMSPRTAGQLGIEYTSFAHGGEHGGYDVPLVTLRVGDRQVEAPAWIMPGHADGSITVYLGYGQRDAARTGGTWQSTLGFNAYTAADERPPVVRAWARRDQVGDDLSACLHPGPSRDGRTRSDPRRHAGRISPRCAFHRRKDRAAARGDWQRRQAAARNALRTARLQPTKAQVGHVDRHHGLHRLQRLRRRLPGGEQHPRRRQGAGPLRPRNALDPHRPLCHRRNSSRRRNSTFSPCPACIANTRRANTCARSRRPSTVPRG